MDTFVLMILLTTALMSSIGTFLSGLAAIYAAKARMEAHEAKEAVVEVVRQTNHIKDELVAEVRSASFAAGEKSEADKQR
jgi:hypothetical protein